MKKSNFIVFFLLFMIYFFPVIVYFFEESEISLNPNDYARITDVDYKAVVLDESDSGGKVHVTERITYDIHAASKDNPFWELWRDLPEDYVDGLKIGYEVKSVKQILEDGSEIEWSESPKLYWDDYDYINTVGGYGPGKWYHSEGPYNESLRDYECIFFYIDGLYREKVTFEIEYEMSNAALRYNDCSELYLCMYSEETIKHLNSFKGQILLKSKDMPSKENYEAHTYGTNSHEFAFTESTTINPGYHTFSFELDESQLKFRPYNQYIEFNLVSFGDDKHLFTEYAPDNLYSSDDVLDELRDEQEEYESLPEEAEKNKWIMLVICFVGGFLIIKILLMSDNFIEKKYTFYKPPMEIDYFRDIPSNLDPIFASVFVFCKDKMPKDVDDNYAALMLSLVRKKYIELVRINDHKDWSFYNSKIIIKHKPLQHSPDLHLEESPFYDLVGEDEQNLEPLTPCEELYYNLIVKYAIGSEISMSTFQSKVSSDYESTDSFVSNIDIEKVNIGINERFFQKADYKKPRRELKTFSKIFATIGILLVTLINIISYHSRLDLAYGAFFFLGISFLFGAFHLNHLSKKYVLLTQHGENEYQKWRGLYNFLNSETLMDERTVVELPMWEQYLVYATAFGISDKVIKAINIKCPEMELASNSMLSNSYYRSRSFHSSGRSFRSAARSASHTARSGGYGGFSYGGGGRGGGGGGGGH